MGTSDVILPVAICAKEGVCERKLRQAAKYTLCLL